MKTEPEVVSRIGQTELCFVADLIAEGMAEGYYDGLLPCRNRGEVMVFLQHLLEKRTWVSLHPHTLVEEVQPANLLVFQVAEKPLGFLILRDMPSKGQQRRVELTMFSIRSNDQGQGYGSFVLDCLLRNLGQEGVEIQVRCHRAAPLFFAMLMTRGFVSLPSTVDGVRLLRQPRRKGVVAGLFS